jgi:hypothetical protein
MTDKRIPMYLPCYVDDKIKITMMNFVSAKEKGNTYVHLGNGCIEFNNLIGSFEKSAFQHNINALQNLL